MPKITNAITLSVVNDGEKGDAGKGIKSNTKFYCLQESPTAPDKPTTNPPDSKWGTTEPSYTMGSTSYLYTVDLTVYTDDSFLYSDVSLSSSYEAAKAAYAKAVNAETEIEKTNEQVALRATKNEVTETLKGYATTASMNAAITTKANEITSSVAANYTTKNEFDSLQIGGTNFILNSSFSGLPNSGLYTFNGEEVTFSASSTGEQSGVNFFLSVSDSFRKRARNNEITISIEYKVEDDLIRGTTNPYTGIELAVSRDDVTGGSSQWFGCNLYEEEVRSDKWKKLSVVCSITDYDISYVGSGIWFRDIKGTIKFRHPKVEIGNKATDWSPAPEDIESRVASAETRITQNETSINSKASQTELSGLTTRVSTAEQNIDAANAAISQKAEKTEVNTLSNTINETKTVVDQNSSKWSVAATKVENMRLAGDNILKKQDYGLNIWPDGNSYGTWADFNSDWLKPYIKSGYGFYRDPTTGSAIPLGSIRNLNLKNGTKYTLSFIGFCGSPSATFTETQNIQLDILSMSDFSFLSDGHIFTLTTSATLYHYTFSSVQNGINNCCLRFIAYNTNEDALKYQTWIGDLMLTEGEIPARWSPSPFDGAKTTTVTVDHNGMYVTTGGTVEFNTNKFEITPPDGGDQLFSVNASTRNLKAQNGYFTYLSAPNMAIRSTDTSGTVICQIGGSGQYPSIQAAWDSIPDVCGNVYFEVNGNVSGYAYLTGKYVSCLRIRGNGDTKYTIGRIVFNNLTAEMSNVTAVCDEGEWDTSIVLFGSKLYCHDAKITSSGYGIISYVSSTLTIHNCEFTGAGSYSQPRHLCIYSVGGLVDICNCTGGGTQTGLYLDFGALAVLRGTVPGASVDRGSGYILGTAGTDYTFSGSVPEPPVVTKTATFIPSTWCTWECLSGSLWKRLTVGVAVQSRGWSGLNNKEQYPNGFCKRAGWWVLDTGTAIKDALSGKTISRATITIRRDVCSETYKVELAYHGVTNCNLNGYSVSANYNIANQLISMGLYDIKGDSDTVIDLPSSLYSKLQDGTIKGFGLLNNSSYYKDVYCDGTCTLNVTYT